MQNEISSTNYFLMGLLTSSSLAIVGFILFIIQISALMTLFALVICIIGIVQVIVDLGWVSINKINMDLPTWNEAYVIVARKRNLKIFLIPFLFDIVFVIISLAIIVSFGMN